MKKGIDKMILMVSCVAIFSTVGTFSIAYAIQQPYIAGLGYDSTGLIYHPDTFFYLTKFTVQTGGNPNQNVLSVLSTAGSTSASGSSGVTGVFYQVVSEWDAPTDNGIWADDQVWIPAVSTTSPVWQANPNVALCDQPHEDRVTGNPVWSTDRSKITFTHTCYFKNGMINSVPFTYTRNTSQDTSTYFLAGKCAGNQNGCVSGGSSTIGFDQFGTESNGQTGQFDVQQYLLQFHDSYDYPGNPHQVDLANLNAILVQQNDANVGWYTDSFGTNHLIGLGGVTFNNVYAKAKSTDGSQSAGTVVWDARNCNGNACQSSFIPLW